MADKSLLPTRTEMEKLFGALCAPGEEMDEACAAEVLEQHGLDSQTLVAGFEARLAREVQTLEAEGKHVPKSLLDALSSVRASAQTAAADEADVDPKEWLDHLLSNQTYGNSAGEGRSYHLQSFRELKAGSLTGKDREILDALATELETGEEE